MKNAKKKTERKRMKNILLIKEFNCAVSIANQSTYFVLCQTLAIPVNIGISYIQRQQINNNDSALAS